MTTGSGRSKKSNRNKKEQKAISNIKNSHPKADRSVTKEGAKWETGSTHLGNADEETKVGERGMGNRRFLSDKGTIFAG